MNQRPTVAFLTAAFMGLSFAAAEPPPASPTPPAPKSPERAPEKPAAPAPSREGRVDLRPKFELGQVVRYSLKQVMDQVVPNQADPKDPSKTHQEQTVGLKMTTKSVDKETGEASIEIVYETVKAKLDGPLGVVDFDSSKPAPKGGGKKSDDPLDAMNDMALEQFKNLVGTKMTMKVARDGRITSITGGESLAPSVPGVTQAWGDAMKQLGGLFGPINSNSSTGFDGTAKVGEKWTHRDSLTVGPIGGLDMLTTYELRSHQSNLAKVYFNGHAEKKSSGEPALVSVDEAKYNGLYNWDTKRGQLSRCEIEQKTTMSGSLTGGQPSTATTTVVLERTDKK